MKESIDDDFYYGIFDQSGNYIKDAKQKNEIQVIDIEKILNNRNGDKGLGYKEIAEILTLLRANPNREAKDLVIRYARKLRKKLFKNHVSLMVPIELSNYCASNCFFCGWRADNKKMNRFAISYYAIEKQVRTLNDLGFNHFELVGGDDIQVIKELPGIIKQLRKELDTINPNARISICMTPLTQKHYDVLKSNGLDTVLNWQETYNKELFDSYITKGPKAKGINDHYEVVKNGDGFLARLKAQEYAIKAGLQIGLGVLLLMSNDIETDILSAIIHGRELIGTYQNILPVIIGMPIWNSITTKETDNLKNIKFDVNIEKEFEFISAIYLLGFPDHKAWIFPNCRVSKKTQIETILTAGCFTSTMVRVGPGAYLDIEKENLKDIFTNCSVDVGKIDNKTILQSEQFRHHYHSHELYMKEFRKNNLIIVPEDQLIP
jgi:2-iminoacetate synthase